MRFNDLTPAEQAKLRFLWHSQTRSVDARRFRCVTDALHKDSLRDVDEVSLLDGIREMRRQLDLAL